MEYLIDETMRARLRRVIDLVEGQVDLSSPPGYGPPPMSPDRHGHVWLHNNSGAARAQYDILGISGSDIDPATAEADFYNRIALVGAAPTADHLGKFAVLLEPIASDGRGWAIIAGTVQCRLQVDDANCTWADIDTTDPTRLLACGGGAAQILYRQSGTGLKKAVVRIGVAVYPRRRATLSADCAAGATVEAVDIDTAETLDVTDAILPSGFQLDEGTTVFLDRFLGDWHITGAPFVAATPLTNWEYNDPECQIKTQVVAVLAKQTESDWDDRETAEDGACT